MISPPAARISQCSRPTALRSSSSERKELEQTISAKLPVRWAKVPTLGRISWITTGTPSLRRLPGGFGSGHAAADDVKGLSRHVPEVSSRATAGVRDGQQPGSGRKAAAPFWRRRSKAGGLRIRPRSRRRRRRVEPSARRSADLEETAGGRAAEPPHAGRQPEMHERRATKRASARAQAGSRLRPCSRLQHAVALARPARCSARRPRATARGCTGADAPVGRRFSRRRRARRRRKRAPSAGSPPAAGVTPRRRPVRRRARPRRPPRRRRC